ncbi:hypothetical protein PACTADRAFT_2130 [Pachysolen tannophilus NRRL Y-2460]|uniref:Uncharacterized protein n=1 Tax=Pachysolen tannophilus NRRL Y-2460 TaxID=669874 RepID=A0A1E4TVN7_PACTA|nr:hypothetical protein PACTADRAFT_2130 [Pachysolen tannophilus NRRL Y-2460]
MSEKSYIEVKNFVELQIRKLLKPLILDNSLSIALEQRNSKSLTTKETKKLLIKLNQTRIKFLKKFFTKQAIHAITAQYINNETQLRLKSLENLLNLHQILIPFKINDLNNNIDGNCNKNIHEFWLDKDSNERKFEILTLVDELPESSHLLSNISDENKDNSQEILQKYEYLRNKILNNKKKLINIHLQLQKRKYLENLLLKYFQNLKDLQKNLVISSNPEIIDEINTSRILIEKVSQKI